MLGKVITERLLLQVARALTLCAEEGATGIVNKRQKKRQVTDVLTSIRSGLRVELSESSGHDAWKTGKEECGLMTI